jgi:NAD+ kinase
VSKCIVTSDRRTISVTMSQNARRNAFLSVDGGRAYKMNMGDTAVITCSRLETRLVRLKDRSFYDIINNKLKHYD